MPVASSRITTVTFDSFSTLVDVDSTASAIAEYVDDPIPFAREWHDRAAAYGMIANYLDAYDTYFNLHCDALDYLLTQRGVSLSNSELEEITEIYYEMEPFDDVYDGITQLRDAGYTVGVISNGDPKMLDALGRVTGLADVLSVMVSADEIQLHKPAQDLYEHAASRLDTVVEEVVHVSYGYVDVQGAMHAGMAGVWINRVDAPPDPFGPDPDATIESIYDLSDLLSP